MNFADDPVDWPTNLGLSPARYKVVRQTAGAMLQAFHEDREYGALEEYLGLTDQDERLALWAILRPHPSLRSSIKRQIDVLKGQASHDTSGA